MEGKVYLLRNPLDDTVFYVGQTIYKLSERLRNHLSEKNNGIKNKIISEIINKNLFPIIEELESINYNEENKKLLNEKEIFWIKHYNPIGNKMHVLFYAKKCIVCGNDFESKRERAMYCSDICRAIFGQKKKKIANTKINDSPKFKKSEKCEYCNTKMDSCYRSKRFCSDKCRVYFNRENIKKKILKTETTQNIKKELSKAELFKLMREGKI